MTEPISTVGLIDFVHNFTTRKINRFLNARVGDLFDKRGANANLMGRPSSTKSLTSTKTKPLSRGRSVHLRDVDSHSFSEVVLTSNKVIISVKE